MADQRLPRDSGASVAATDQIHAEIIEALKAGPAMLFVHVLDARGVRTTLGYAAAPAEGLGQVSVPVAFYGSAIKSALDAMAQSIPGTEEVSGG